MPGVPGGVGEIRGEKVEPIVRADEAVPRLRQVVRREGGQKPFDVQGQEQVVVGEIHDDG